MSDKKNLPEDKLVDVQKNSDESVKQILLPHDMSNMDAIKWLERKIEEDEQEVGINEVFDAYPGDGAHALVQTLKEIHGFTALKTKRGFFGSTPPTMIGVRTGPNPEDVVQVPWGQVEIPGVEGYLETGITIVKGRPVFTLGGVVKRKNEKDVADIACHMREYLATNSIYQGKAIRIEFPDLEDARSLQDFEPEFLDLSNVKPNELIFSAEVTSNIECNLFTPILHSEMCRQAGIPLKRGVLLAGPYGTGKTMTAYVAAKYAEENGWTFLYLKDVNDLAIAVQFAKMYGPAVIFAEDLDNALGTSRRDTEVNEILNTIDGVDSKDTEVIVCLTTNHVDRINKAMLRPGRLDAVINVTPPDGEAALRLVKQYARGLLDESGDFTEVKTLLNGKIPAVIRETVERAKLAAINGNPTGDFKINAEALVVAARSMKAQLKLLTPQEPDDRSEIERAADSLKDGLLTAFFQANTENGETNGTVNVPTARQVLSENANAE